MGLTERVWDAFARTIRLADKVEQLTATVFKQQHHIENLTGPWHGFVNLRYTYSCAESPFLWRLAWHGAIKSSPTEHAR